MDFALWFGRTYLVPGSPMFLVLGLAFCLLILGASKTSALPRRALWALLGLYIALSMPFVSGALARALGGTQALERADAIREVEAIVLIGCGVISTGSHALPIHLPGLETAWNISEAARLYRLSGGRRIISTGGMPPGGSGRVPESEVMQQHLLRMGVPARDIVLESDATNTLQQARNVAALLPRGARVVLVTVPTHMPRTSGFFRAQGLQVTEAVSGLADSEQPPTLAARFIPNRHSLRASERAMYEVLGLTYYWIRGDFRR